MTASFELVQLSENAWLAIGRSGTSNVTFVRTDSGAVVIDSFAEPTVARELSEHVHALAGAPKLIIVTHHHADHWAGLPGWGDVTRCGHPETVKILDSVAAEYQLIPGEVIPFPALLRLWVGDAAARLLGVDSENGVVRRLREMTVRSPVLFPDIRPLQLGERLGAGSVQVRTIDFGVGHGDDDLVVSIIDGEDEILVLGDLAFFGRVPVLGGPYLDEWLDILLRLEDYARAVDSEGRRLLLVPGHGSVGSVDEVQKQSRYLRSLRGGHMDCLPGDWSDERSRDWHDVNVALASGFNRN